MPLTIGDTFAAYRVLRLLGSGGMGEVYLVQHPRLPRQEALKVLRPEFSQDPSFRERFIREADLASALRHPHIVGIHDRGEHDGQLWIAMDYVDGADLSHLLERRYPQGMPVGHVLPIVTAVASALDYAHKKCLLHRDVKPANIIVADLDTDDPKISLADFGIARPLDDTSGITTTNMTVGTVAYAAPEQLMGEQLDGRADQYALASTIYHLLTGSKVFAHTNPAVVISHHLSSPSPAVSETHVELRPLDSVLAHGLAKQSFERYSNCGDLAQAFAEGVKAMNLDGKTRAAAKVRPAPAEQPSRGPSSKAVSRPSKNPTSPLADSGEDTFWDRHAIAISVTSIVAIAASISVVLAVVLADDSTESPAQTASGPSITQPKSTLSATTPPSTSAAASPTATDPPSDWEKPPTVTVTATPPATADVGFSASEQAFLTSVASVNGANGYDTGPMFFDAIDGNAVSKQQQDRALVDRGHQLCAALDDGLDSAAARQRVLGPLNDHSTDMFDYYGAIFIGYATYRLCPEHSDKTGQI